MEKMNPLSSNGVSSNVFDEMAIQMRLLALNLALESGRGEFVEKIAKGIFSKAVNLCDSIEMTAQEISSLLNSFSEPSGNACQKTIAKLDELASHIGEISSLVVQSSDAVPLKDDNRQHGGTSLVNEKKAGQNERFESLKTLFNKTFEIQNMLRRFRSDLAHPAPAS